MLHTTHPFYFPTLHRFGETSFKSWEESGRTTGLYTLDWEKVDQSKKDHFLKNDAVDSNMKFPGTLPKEYDEYVRKMTFAIPDFYLREIRNQSYMALTEWNGNYPFDTVIREMCLKPAIAHTYVAFRLISDCLYDPITNYFSREPMKIIAPQVLLYKFWVFQTGRGLIRDHAEFRMIEDMQTIRIGGDDSDSYQIREFLTAIDLYENDLNELYRVKLAKTWSNCQDSSFNKGIKISDDDVNSIVKLRKPGVC